MLKTHIVKATYDWLINHKFTPYVLVDTEYENVVVPAQYIDNDKKILLDLSPQAIQNLRICNNKISCDATFDGEFISMVIPIKSVLELFSKETEQGIYARELGYDVNDSDLINSNEDQASSGNILTID